MKVKEGRNNSGKEGRGCKKGNKREKDIRMEGGKKQIKKGMKKKVTRKVKPAGRKNKNI